MHYELAAKSEVERDSWLEVRHNPMKNSASKPNQAKHTFYAITSLS